MKKSHRHFKLNMLSLTENNQVVKGTSQFVSQHEVETQYRILSINEFRTVNNVGFFNKKTDFRIGEENSILVLDNNFRQLSIKTSEIKDDQYLVYPMPFSYLEQNLFFLYDHYSTSKKIQINLTFEFGEIISKMLLFLSQQGFKEFPAYLEEIKLANPAIKEYPKELYKLLISFNNYGYSINKNLLLNSNTDFLLGILNGLEFNQFSNINIYTFTTILNYLGAMYSVTRGTNDTRKINFYLPEVFREYEKLNNRIIKYKNDRLHINDIQSKIDDEFKESVLSSNLWEQINKGTVLLIKTQDLIFSKLSNDQSLTMYDFTMQRADATNFTIPYGPVLKNSDGDILGVIGLFGKESLQEASSFSPENRDYYKSFNDGSIQSWVTKDAVLGLYNVTKTIK